MISATIRCGEIKLINDKKYLVMLTLLVNFFNYMYRSLETSTDMAYSL